MDEQARARFDKKIDRQPTGCWLWTGAKNHHGYGGFRIGKRVVLAHRAAYEDANGLIAAGLQVRHLCPGGGSRACVNPAHMATGTSADNAADKVNAGSAVGINAGSKNGRAVLTDAQVLEIHRRVSLERGVDLAREFGVTHSLISQIKKGRTRPYLNMPVEQQVPRPWTKGPRQRTQPAPGDPPTPAEIARFMKRTQGTNTDCITWKATLSNGYGTFRWRSRTIGAHRFAYLIAHGELPPRDIAHRCGRRSCVNPTHLIAATRAQNMAASHTRRALAVASKGHRHRVKLTDDQICWIKQRFRDDAGATAAGLARELNGVVTPECIANIRKGKTGGHVLVVGFEPSLCGAKPIGKTEREKIKQLKVAGLTQDQIAAQLGRSQAVVSNVLRG